MSFFSFFKKKSQPVDISSSESSLANKSSDIPHTVEDIITVNFSRLRMDVQTVLISDIIKSKSVADDVAAALSYKYSVTTEVTLYKDNEGYIIWLYRIPLNLIEENYDPSKQYYCFNLSELHDGTIVVNADEIIKGADVGSVLGIAFEVELARTPDRFHLLFEDAYYMFYTYYSGHFIRVDKNTNCAVYLGKYVHIECCATLRGKLFFYESRGMIGDREIYSCNLDGTNVTPLHCLSNKKTFIAGHPQSEDEVINMQVIDDHINVTVCRQADSGTFNYSLNITYINGQVYVIKA